jgi:hypothetical protein
MLATTPFRDHLTKIDHSRPIILDNLIVLDIWIHDSKPAWSFDPQGEAYDWLSRVKVKWHYP